MPCRSPFARILDKWTARARLPSQGKVHRIDPPLGFACVAEVGLGPNRTMRTDGRRPDELRPLTFRRRYTRQAPGSVLVRQGRTLVLCTCTVEQAVPPFLMGTGKGWLTAEYGMLPGSTNTRKARDRGGKVDGRSVEIQRLIGRSLRAVVDLTQLGERTLWIDCDVLEADGGTRTASINGAFVALLDALAHLRKLPLTPPPPLPSAVVRTSVAAVSVGLL